MFSSDTLKKPDYRRAEREAIRLLNEAGVFQPPVDPVSIARLVGVGVHFVTFSGDSEGVAGVYDPSENEILVNADEAGVRQTFTVAHELGHKILHEEWARGENYRVLWRDPSRQSKDRREQEANAFAANLLMPRGMLKEYKHLPADSVARIFAVSEQFARYRLQNLYGI